MIIIWCKIFKPVLKDYLLLHYFALGTFSTTGVQIIKYLLTHIPCCILICITWYFNSCTNNMFHTVLYYTVLYACYDLSHILELKMIYGMRIKVKSLWLTQHRVMMECEEYEVKLHIFFNHIDLESFRPPTHLTQCYRTEGWVDPKSGQMIWSSENFFPWWESNSSLQ